MVAFDFAAAALECGLPCEDAAALAEVGAGDAKLGFAVARGRIKALRLAFDQAGGCALLVFKDQLDFAFARACRIAPVHRVVVAEPLVAFGGGDGPMKSSQLLHAHHRLLGRWH